MPVFDRPQLRRRSQSEQVVPTKAALAMTAMPIYSDASAGHGPALQCTTPVIPSQYAEDIGRPEIKTPLMPHQSLVGNNIECKKAVLPPKPNVAVLAAAAKNQKKQVLFSTPTSSMRRSPTISSHDRRAVFPTPGISSKYTSPEHQVPPPPPYTPAGASMNAAHQSGSSRPFDYACTPACTSARHAPAPRPNQINVSQTHLNTVTTIFPSVIAASEALRINLGLDGSTTLPFGATYLSNAPMSSSLQRSPSIPGLAMPAVHYAAPADGPAYSGGTKVHAVHEVQHKILASLEPLPGMTQPLRSASSNLPPVINTGHKGPMRVQPGDWGCLVCSFVNWRRRKYCMRCCPFAEGNTNIPPAMLASMAAAQNPLYASMAATTQPVYPVYATPPRPNPSRNVALLGPAILPGPFIQTNMPRYNATHFVTTPGPMQMSGLTMLQSPFGPMHSVSAASVPVYRRAFDVQQGVPGPVARQDHGAPESSAFLYDSGYGRYSNEQDAYHAQPQQAKIVELDRPITPSPTGSQASGCSFAFSNASPSDADSPTTSIDSNGSTSSVSSPETASKTLRTPPSSKFRDFGHDGENPSENNVRPEDSTTNIEQRLDDLRI